MKPHPNFDGRTRKALLLEGEPDRVPQVELWIDNMHMSRFHNRPINTWFMDAKAAVEFWCAMGYDYVHIPPYYVFPKNAPGHMDVVCGKADRVEVAEDRGLITTDEEFEKYPWITYESIDFSIVENAFPFLPDGFKVISGTFAGVFEETSQLMGFNTLAVSLFENPALVRRVVNAIGSLYERLIATVAEMPKVGAVWVSDDIAYRSATMFSPEFYREYIFPWYRKFGDICRRTGKPFMYHSDGNLWSVLDDLIGCGINSVHPVEPLGMDIIELKKEYGDRLCICGNIALENELTMGTPGEVEAAVKKRISELGPGGGYCCGSSNTVTDYVPHENFLAMVRAIQMYGAYPM